MKIKLSQIIIGCFFLVIWACKSRYVDEVPYVVTDDYVELINEYVAERDIDTASRIYYPEYEGLTDEQIELKEVFAIVLDVEPKLITDYDFYRYVYKWIGTPYRENSLQLGEGADCVYFISQLYNELYDVPLPREAHMIYKSPHIDRFRGRAYLREGDILFFRYTKERPISDMAIYLHKNRIVACTKEYGLHLYDFNDKYFQTRFVAIGRAKIPDTKE